MTSPRELLGEHNPFVTGAVGTPWERLPDIESINYEAYQGVMNLIKSLHTNPKAATAALVFGEAGTGKTHLIGRILRSSNREEMPYLFVYIEPILNPDTPMRHLLKNIVNNFTKEYDQNQGYNTFDWLIIQMLTDYFSNQYGGNEKILARIRQDPSYLYKLYSSNEFKPEVISGAIDFIVDKWDIPKILLKVVFQLMYAGKRKIALSWLRLESLDDEDCSAIGLRNHIDKTETELEEEAHDLIIALGKLIGRCNRIMLVCFDQFENYRTDEHVKAFEIMIETLINWTDAILPLSFMRTELWDNRIKDKLHQGTVDRMMHRFQLSGCTLIQANELIRERIRSYLPNHWEEPYNWLSAEIKGKIKEGYSPRQIIHLANLAIQEIPPSPTDPSDDLAELFNNECDLVAAKLIAPDMEKLLYSLENFLQYQPSVNEIQKAMREKINLRGTVKDGDRNYNYAFIVNTQEHHKTIGACMQRGTEFMEGSGANRCVYITDPRCIISKNTWSTTNEKIERFKQKGGKILNIDKNEVNRWYALHSFLLKTTEGDISYMDERGMTRRFTDDEMSSFIGTSAKFGPPLITFSPSEPTISIPPIQLPPLIPPVPTIRPRSDEALLTEIRSYLRRSPMRSIATDTLLSRLNTAGFMLHKEELLEFCGSREETFRIYLQKVGSMIMLLEVS